MTEKEILKRKLLLKAQSLKILLEEGRGYLGAKELEGAMKNTDNLIEMFELSNGG